MAPQRFRSAVGALLLFAVNAYITSRLFHVVYTRQMGSIEAAFISLARYIRDHFPHFTWFPLWYGGIPFADTYPPLLPFAVAGLSKTASVSPALAYHFLTALFYALGPVALFWTAMQLGARRSGAFLGALGYSLLSPSCWLVRQVRAETGGWFEPRRLVTLVPLGEGPHIASLVFLALSIGMLHLALTQRKPYQVILTSLSMAATVLCNWIGAMALAFSLAAYLLVGFHCVWKPAWVRSVGIGLYAYVVALPWVSPSTLATIRASAPRLVGFNSSLWPFCILAASLPLLAWILKHSRLRPALRFAVLFFYGPAVLSLASYWFHLDLLPQAHRYHLEMDLAFWMAVALFATVPRKAWIAGAVVIPLVVHQHRQAYGMEAPIQIESTAEYRISHWFGNHMPGRRVFAPGSVSFWMNAFSDTPMLAGGFDNGIRNQFLWDVNYQILAGDKLSIALSWLKAFGCDAIVGDDMSSHEVFHPYAHPEKLHSLPELWREGPEVIYAVPRRGSLAHVIRASDIVRMSAAAYETKSIDHYLAALDDVSLPNPTFYWRDPATAVITADLQPEYLLSVQETWDQGWKAKANGVARPVWRDALGQIVIGPKCSGACTVELYYDGFELQFARYTSMLALAAGAAWLIWKSWRRRTA